MASGPTASSPAGPAGRYRFDDVEVDTVAHAVRRAGELQPVEPKAFAVLLALLRRPGALIGRDELLDEVWGHRHVTPGVLTRAIAQLRTALADDSHQPRYIRTQHAVGYAFIGTLAEDDLVPPAADPPAPEPPAPAASTPPTPDAAAPPRRAGPRRASDRRRGLGWLAAAAAAAALAWFTWSRQAPPLPAEPSVAVLPFTTLGGPAADDWFAEGLALEMIGALSAVDGLKVAAGSGDAVDRRGSVQEVGRALGVATVLDASVQRDGSQVRIRARLTDTATGYTLWSRAFDRDVTAVFETQTEIATEVAQALVGVLPDAGAGLRRRLTPTRDVGAFDAYLQGLQALVAPAAAEDAALDHFRSALAKDPGFARAQANICRIELWRFEAQRAADAFESARLACLRAAGMDPTIGTVQLALGDLYRAQGPLDKALVHYRLAEADVSVRADAISGEAMVYAAQGKPDLSARTFRQALEIAPDDPVIHAQFGYQLYLAEDLPAAVASYRRATELDPGDAHLWSTLGGLLMASDRNDEAVVAFERSRAIEPIDAVLANLGTLHYQAGDYAQAATMYRQAIELNPDTNPSNWGSLADALLADPATAAQAPAMYREAADRAQAYVDLKDDDAKALAMLGWFRANLGEAEAARDLIRRSEALGRQPGEVAIYNAQTFVALGEPGPAAERIAAARAAGAAESRLSTNAVLRRANLVGSSEAATPSPHAAGTRGESDEP